MPTLHNPGRIERRVQQLREQVCKISIERARLFTASYRETEGEPAIIRRAKAVAKVLREMKVMIYDDELITGNRSVWPRMGVLSPEMAVEWIEEELDSFPVRPQDPFEITEEEKRELREDILPYWRGKTLQDWIRREMPGHVMDASLTQAFKLNQTDKGQGHVLADKAKVIERGLLGIREEVAERLEMLGVRGTPGLEDAEDLEEASRRCFYEAALIVLDAACELGRRYRDEALRKASQERDERRNRELLELAKVLERVPNYPARTFWEALQSLWLTHIILQCESNASSISFGRIDQYLYPYYKHDIAAGLITQEDAQELLDCFWIKCNEIVAVRSRESAKHFAGFPINPCVTVGGQGEDGQDVTNELSFMCLQAIADVRMPQPNTAVRLHTRTPDELLVKAAEVIRLGIGIPHLYNDEVVIPALLNRGVTLSDARNYAIVGCVEISIPGKTYGLHDIALFNLVKVLEHTMKGMVPKGTVSTVSIGGPDGAPATFEEFEQAYERQTEYFVKCVADGCNTVDKAHAAVAPTPFLSCLVEDCVGKGRDITAGGAHYNFSGVQGIGIANVANSLAAIKKAVFEEKWVTWEELMGILDRNYDGAEELRLRLYNSVSKYGNDDEYVDRFAAKWARKYCLELEKYENSQGGRFQAGMYSVSSHAPLGQEVGATPDGRRAGEPLADGGISPVRGTDRRGPTAVLRSAARIDHVLSSNGSLLNLKFLPSTLEGPNGIAKFVTFLRAFVMLKVAQVQFNVISSQTLLDAQAHPENYRNLVVRVAGYSAYFIDLSKDIQDDIIMRTEQSL
ncbi:MAG: glycyl radical protein [Firmicutes bacterium]|nr:glycyl radical protein [Bacillota bacterium]